MAGPEIGLALGKALAPAAVGMLRGEAASREPAFTRRWLRTEIRRSRR